MKLIKECFTDTKLITEEQSDGEKFYYIEGIFLQSNKENRNGRIYPSHILEKEVERYNKDYIQKKRSLGELGHPDQPSLNLDKVSHLITSLEKSGEDYIGRAKLMNTPMGEIAKSLVKEGVTLGVSSRGMGSIKPIGSNLHEVQDDYFLSTVDIVADPSAHDAFVEGIYEGKEWIWNNGSIVEKDVETIKNEIEKNVKNRVLLEEARLRAFNKFLKSIK